MTIVLTLVCGALALWVLRLNGRLDRHRARLVWLEGALRDERRRAQAGRERSEEAVEAATPEADTPEADVPEADVPDAGAPGPDVPEFDEAPSGESVESSDAADRPLAVPPALSPATSPAVPTSSAGVQEVEVEVEEEWVEGAPSRVPQIDWERWIGVRGAAVLGGVVLALAAVLFLRYSIERGLIPPIVRVAFGFLAGVGSLVGSETVRRRGYRAVADATAGAGVVILYASTWAARELYELIPAPVAWALMVLVTVVCGLLSWRREARLIALLGLAGGFATPLLLSSAENDPLSLFAYLLLLDIGLLWLARRNRWPILAGLSLAGTFLYQTVWIVFGLEADRLPLALVVLGVFAALYVLAAPKLRSTETSGEGSEELLSTWTVSRIGALVLPFLLTLMLAARTDLGERLWPLAVLAALLTTAAVWLDRGGREPPLSLGAAGCLLALWTIWNGARQLTVTGVWETAAVAILLALALHWPLELRRRGRVEEAARAALVFSLGAAFVWCCARLPKEASALAPWLAGLVGLASLALRQARLLAEGWRLAAAALPPLGLAALLLQWEGPARLSASGVAAFAVLASFPYSALALRRAESAERWRRAALLAPCATLLVLAPFALRLSSSPWVFLITTLALGALACFACASRASGRGYVATGGSLAMAQWAGALAFLGSGIEGAPIAVLVCGTLAVVLLAFWPFVHRGRLLDSRPTLYVAALAAPVWFLPLRAAWLELWGDRSIALLPLALGGITCAAAACARRVSGGERVVRQLAWLLGVAIGFLALAIPLQLDREWLTLGWALQGAALVWLWRRLDHPGLRYAGLALLAVVTARLVANPAVLGYHAKASVPVLNWLLYAYGVPVAALIAAATFQAPLEIERRTARERDLYDGPIRLGAAACGLAAIVVSFVWVNLTIFDAFADGPVVRLTLDRMPARDLTLSLAWIVFAVALLALGMARHSSALRWLSLAFLVLAIGKVFLYDLGELEELYRVASLAGLAISLLLVSLAYQRFVFGRDKPRE